MGRLSASTLAAIEAGAKTRQHWALYVPQAAGSTTYDAVTLHDDDGGPQRVIDAGNFEASAYNVSFASPGSLTSGYYSVVVRNDDQMLYPTASSNVWINDSTSYQAMPSECHLRHRLYVWAAGAWSSVYDYRGKIQDMPIDDDNERATIESIGLAADALSLLWSADDGTETDTGLDLFL